MTTRRAFLLTVSALPAWAAAARKTCVLADLGGRIGINTDLLQGLQRDGYDGFIDNAPDLTMKVKSYGALPNGDHAAPLYAIRAAMPRFEDNMDDATGALKTLAGLAEVQGARALILTHPGLSGNGAFRPVDLERKARMLDIAGAICSTQGLTLLYQNGPLELTGNAAEERALMIRTDPKRVSFLLDTGDPDFFQANQKRIAGIRLTDAKDGDLAQPVHRTRWTGWLVVPLRDVPIENFKAVCDRVRQAFSS
jgi:sugar phosphate isomerase/epimerase